MRSEGGPQTGVVEMESISLTSPKKAKKGLSLWLAAVFIVGEMAGSGVLALPMAFSGMGWSAVAMLLVCCLNALYSGICLGRCWMILEERWSEYKHEKFRYPYPAIAQRAVGTWMRYIVSFCVDFTLFGVATVFLLLSAQMIGDLAQNSGIYFCYWILILATILCPLMWLGTPEDFWPAAVVALMTTILACILIVVAIAKDKARSFQSRFPSPDVWSFFLSFGTILFAFGGASTFPTFQNDMRDRSQFSKAAIIAFCCLLVLYLPVAVMGYSVYGGDLQSNILSSLPDTPIKSTIEVLLAIHLFFAFLLAINAPMQEIEEYFKVPNNFNWKRCVVRTAIMLVIVFVGQSIPRFGKILNLVGGSTVTLMTFIFPPLFYMLLCRQTQPEWPERFIPLHEKAYLIEIMVLGIIGGCISTYSSIKDIADPSAFNPPCYVNIIAASKQ